MYNLLISTLQFIIITIINLFNYNYYYYLLSHLVVTRVRLSQEKFAPYERGLGSSTFGF